MSARPSTRQPTGASPEGIDSFQLPKALVTRIAKSVLPHDAKLQKETISTLANGATVFINYLGMPGYDATCLINDWSMVQPRREVFAQDVASSRSRKTIAGQDILKALELIEFGDLVPILQGELESYRGIGKADKGKGKAAELKGKGKEKDPSSVVSGTLKAVALASESSRKDVEPEPGFSENDEGREEGGLDVDAYARDEEEEHEEEGEVEEGEGEGEEEEEEEEDDIEADEADVAGNPEEVVDMVAVEEAELQKDQRGLEDINNGED
ncbi:hypothetical protein JB92DRAFT_3116708 [Gautieria morchelliformis]|nr:hypothetical protein JB92DRAFT_3116708 [Gautieria morchelliformis]